MRHLGVALIVMCLLALGLSSLLAYMSANAFAVLLISDYVPGNIAQDDLLSIRDAVASRLKRTTVMPGVIAIVLSALLLSMLLGRPRHEG